MSIKRCPYCKALIDEGATHCANCGTRLIFPEDDALEEEIPGEKIIEEKPPKKKRRAPRKKPSSKEKEEEIKEIEIDKEDSVLPEGEPEIQLDEPAEEDDSSDIEEEIDQDESLPEVDEHSEPEDPSALEEGEEELPLDEEPDKQVPDEIDEFLGNEEETEIDLEEDLFPFEDIAESDSGELDAADKILEEEKNDIGPDEEEPDTIIPDVIEDELTEPDEGLDPAELEEDSKEFEKEQEIESGEQDFLELEDVVEEPEVGEADDSEGVEEPNDLEGLEFSEEAQEEIEEEVETDFDEPDFSTVREPSKPLPEEPYRRTHTQDKIVGSEESPSTEDTGDGESDAGEKIRPPSHKTGDQLNIFDPMEKEKEDIERFLDSLKQDRKSLKPISDTGELPPWAAEIKNEEKMAEEMAAEDRVSDDLVSDNIVSDDMVDEEMASDDITADEGEDQIDSGEPQERPKDEEKAPAAVSEKSQMPRTAQGKFYFESETRDVFEDKIQKSTLFPWLKCRLLDVTFVALLWAISLFGASLVLGVSFFSLIRSSTWIVIGFFAILLVQYFFLFSFFLGSTPGSRIFDQKN